MNPVADSQGPDCRRTQSNLKSSWHKQNKSAEMVDSLTNTSRLCIEQKKHARKCNFQECWLRKKTGVDQSQVLIK
jgi:hypothetical protein